MSSGKLFQIFGVATGNALLPTVCSLTEGTARHAWADPRSMAMGQGGGTSFLIPLSFPFSFLSTYSNKLSEMETIVRFCSRFHIPFSSERSSKICLSFDESYSDQIMGSFLRHRVCSENSCVCRAVDRILVRGGLKIIGRGQTRPEMPILRLEFLGRGSQPPATR